MEFDYIQDNQFALIRALNFTFALLDIIVTMPLMIVLSMLIHIDFGRSTFIQKRLGKHRKPFYLLILKLRTMSLDTEFVASHKVDIGKVTQLGRFIR